MANTIKQRVKEALDSPTLGVALDRAPPTFRARRGAYFDSPERTIDFNVERHELAVRRAEGVERLPELVDRFTAEARKIGAVVHHAANAADACAIVSRLAAERGVKTIETLEAASAEWIISGSTSCVVTILQDYPRLFRSEPEWHARALALGKRVIDFTHFVDQVIRPETGTLANGPAFAVTLHDSCQSHNCLRLRPEARRLITDVCGLELRELHESSFCRGFGGSFSFGVSGDLAAHPRS